jgi:hypothetical protein
MMSDLQASDTAITVASDHLDLIDIDMFERPM